MNDEQDRLASVLRQAARASRPAFSDQLHARVRQAIAEDKAGPVTRRPAGPWRQRVAPFALAAAALLGIAFTGWWLSRPLDRGPDLTEAVRLDSDPELLTSIAGQAAEQVGLLVDATLGQQQWAYLDRDFQLATRLLLEQIPLISEPREGGPSPPRPPSDETDG